MVGISEGVTAMATTPTREVQVLLRDDFSGSTVNAGLWHYPVGAPSYNPITQMRAAFPQVANGAVRLQLETHNPTARNPGDSFLGSEIISDQMFSRGAGLAFEARARFVGTLPCGLVGGIFAYEVQSQDAHDEIDFELVSKGQRLNTNVYNEQPVRSPGDTQFVTAPNLATFHTYRIEWLPDRVRWFVDGTLVREETGTVPDDPMALHLNLWAPRQGWVDAECDSFKPVSAPAANTSYFFEVDYAHVARLGSGNVPTSGNDSLAGTANADVINALAGNDTVLAYAGNDTVDGGAGNDSLDGGAGNDVLRGGSENDTVLGGDGTDSVYGGSGNDRLEGSGGNDLLQGEAGSDTLTGGLGRDTLTGGSSTEGDVYKYTSTAESAVGSGVRDLVDFRGAGSAWGNRIDLSAIDANIYQSGDQAFSFIGKNNFQVNKPGTARVYDSGSNTILALNTDNDIYAEAEIELRDGSASASTYFYQSGHSGSDFLL